MIVLWHQASTFAHYCAEHGARIGVHTTATHKDSFISGKQADILVVAQNHVEFVVCGLVTDNMYLCLAVVCISCGHRSTIFKQVLCWNQITNPPLPCGTATVHQTDTYLYGGSCYMFASGYMLDDPCPCHCDCSTAVDT